MIEHHITLKGEDKAVKALCSKLFKIYMTHNEGEGIFWNEYTRKNP